jgi:hypothetical protein
MKIYWSIRSVPELAELPEKNRKEILKKCGLTKFENRNIRYLFGLLTLPFVLGGVTLGEICGGRIGGVMGIVIGGAIGVLVMLQIEVCIVRSRVRKYLFTHGKFD